MSEEKSKENPVVAEAYPTPSDIAQLTATELMHRFPGEWNSWKNAKRRARDESVVFAPEFERFASFIVVMKSKPGRKHTLDRIEPGGPYTPQNCRWATKKLQAKNRRNVELVEHDGQKITKAEAARRLGITPNAMYKRTRGGKAAVEAVLGFDPSNPWIGDDRWEQWYREHSEGSEAPCEFYYRWAYQRYQAIGSIYFPDPNSTPDDLPEPTRAEFEKFEKKWSDILEDAILKRRKFREAIRQSRLARNAERKRNRADDEIAAMREDLGLG